jgi:protease-4
VWSGRDALEIGLVDRLGGLDEAFALAKEHAGLDPARKYPLEIFPRQRTLFETIFSSGWGTAIDAGRRLIATVRLRLDGSAAAGQGGMFESGDALEEWMRRAAAPQVLARAPEIRIR